jgi:hypothetical protein
MPGQLASAVVVVAITQEAIHSCKAAPLCQQLCASFHKSSGLPLLLVQNQWLLVQDMCSSLHAVPQGPGAHQGQVHRQGAHLQHVPFVLHDVRAVTFARVFQPGWLAEARVPL